MRALPEEAVRVKDEVRAPVPVDDEHRRPCRVDAEQRAGGRRQPVLRRRCVDDEARGDRLRGERVSRVGLLKDGPAGKRPDGDRAQEAEERILEGVAREHRPVVEVVGQADRRGLEHVRESLAFVEPRRAVADGVRAKLRREQPLGVDPRRPVAGLHADEDHRDRHVLVSVARQPGLQVGQRWEPGDGAARTQQYRKEHCTSERTAHNSPAGHVPTVLDLAGGVKSAMSGCVA